MKQVLKKGDFEYIPHRDLKRYQSIFEEKEGELSKKWKKKKQIKYSIFIILAAICVLVVWSNYYELDTIGFNILFASAVVMTFCLAAFVCILFSDKDEDVRDYLDPGLIFSKKYEDKEIINIELTGYGVEDIVEDIEYVSKKGNVHKDYANFICINVNIHIDHPILDMNDCCLYLPYDK